MASLSIFHRCYEWQLTPGWMGGVLGPDDSWDYIEVPCPPWDPSGGGIGGLQDWGIGLPIGRPRDIIHPPKDDNPPDNPFGIPVDKDCLCTTMINSALKKLYKNLKDKNSTMRKNLEKLRNCGVEMSALVDCLLNTTGCGDQGTDPMSTIPKMITCDSTKLAGQVPKNDTAGWDTPTKNLYIDCKAANSDVLDEDIFHEFFHICFDCLGYGPDSGGINSELDAHFFESICFWKRSIAL